MHFGTRDDISNPRPSLGETVKIRLKTPANAPIQQVALRTLPNGEQIFTPMRRSGRPRGVTVWTTDALVNEKNFHYRFALQTGSEIWWFNALGHSRFVPLDMFDYKLLADTPAMPWLERSVFYQVFPDRFANGDSSNDPSGDFDPIRGFQRQTFPWGEAAHMHPNTIAFYGGDLQGIRQNLGYLEDLGINAIYLNPIFTAWTNHRYDVIDYRAVDPSLGGDEALVELKNDLRKRGMRYILDIVPNHCGVGHPWFAEARQPGRRELDNYFYFDEDKQKYASWLNVPSLPKLNYQCNDLRKEMYEDEDSIFSYWLKPPFEADGWRVDVGNMLARNDADQLDAEVLPGIRKAVKTTNPGAYLVAENFFDATHQLQGDAWDGVMNYNGFTKPLMFWLAGYTVGSHGWKGRLTSAAPIRTDDMLRAWRETLAAIPWSVALQQFNLLDSHDTPRILTFLKGNKTLACLAAVVQFTFPGVPCVYYGDEIGLRDQLGFGSRNCFPWEQKRWDKTTHSFYKQIIRLRRESRVLAEGAFQVLYPGENLLIYRRMLGKDQVVVTANRRAEPIPAGRIEIPRLAAGAELALRAYLSDGYLTLGDGWIDVPELPQGAEIWLPGSIAPPA